GVALGTPLTALIPNEDNREKYYDHIAESYRPSHADYTYDIKFENRDHRGGGRASARETAARVFAGAIAKLLLRHHGVHVTAYVSQVADIVLKKSYIELDLARVDSNLVRCPDGAVAAQMLEVIEKARKEG